LTDTDFPGLPEALTGFLADLAANNEKAWMNAHRDAYEGDFLEPAKAFVAAMLPALGQVAPGLVGEPRVNGSIKRLNRDVRFSKDKRPYDPRLHVMFWHGAKPKESSGFHCVIGADWMAVGVGIWAFSPAQLETYRQAVAGPAGAGLVEAVAKVEEAAGGGSLREPALKKVSSGFDADAPAAQLLRHKGLVMGQEGALANDLFSSVAVAHVVERFQRLAPLHGWLVTHVTGE